MDCNELYDEAHLTLRTATILARGRARKLTKDTLISTLDIDMEIRHVLDDLEDVGHIAVAQSIVQVLEGCPHKQLVDKNQPGRVLQLTDPRIDEVSQQGDNEYGRAKRGLNPYTPLRGYGDELTRKSDSTIYSYMDNDRGEIDMTSPQTIRRGRVERRVDRSSQRGYRDRPVETWTPADLVAYWDAETLSKLWGRSPDRTNAGALSKVFADLLAENLTPADVRDMIDRYISRIRSTGRKVPSLWKNFIRSKSEIYEQSTNPRTAKFDRTTEGGGDPWK